VVTVIKRKKGSGTYYYLKHNTGTDQIETYLGTKIPPDIEQRKKDFVLDYYRKKWIPKLDAIKQGFIQNKKRIPQSAIKEELEELAIVFTYHTNRIEGSTLSLKDTFDLLLHGLTPVKKLRSDVIETELHRKVFLEMSMSKKPLNLTTLLNWHKQIFGTTKHDHAGQLRSRFRANVRVTNSSAIFPDHSEVPKLMNDFFKWFNVAKARIHPVELAALAHLRFVSIHPFVDGNGRISRLIMNNALFKFDFPYMIVKYEGRFAYYRALERSQTEHNELPFLQWFMKRYIESHFKHYVRG